MGNIEGDLPHGVWKGEGLEALVLCMKHYLQLN